jgi:hypothetical protein
MTWHRIGWHGMAWWYLLHILIEEMSRPADAEDFPPSPCSCLNPSSSTSTSTATTCTSNSPFSSSLCASNSLFSPSGTASEARTGPLAINGFGRNPDPEPGLGGYGRPMAAGWWWAYTSSQSRLLEACQNCPEKTERHEGRLR